MDYYQILGVPEDASADQISNAYRKLALQHHPDRGGDAEKFKEIAAAFEILGNPQKKSQYDQQRKGGGGMPFGMPFGFDIGSFFAHRGPMGRDRNRTVKVDLTLNFVEAALGCRKEIKVKRKQPCVCDEGVEEWQTCTACNGTGQRSLTHGAFIINTPCNACGGAGRQAKKQCSKCSGTGYDGTKDETVAFDIPAGIQSGTVLRAAGMGDVGRDGRTGHLDVAVSVTPHAYFTQNGKNIFCTVPVTYTQLIQGAEIEVPTLTGKAKVTIPPNTPAGKRMRLKGQGIKDGDLYVVLELDLPENMDQDYQATIRKLAELETKFVTTRRKEFGERVSNG